MQTARFPVSGDQKLRPKSGRKPLQPKNSPANPITNSTNPKPKQERGEISPFDHSNKENQSIYATPTKIEALDASLADELSAIRKKLERLRLDKERTEKKLKERNALLEMKMKELEERGEIQKMLENEVDRLYRLKQLKSRCMVSPIRSLRQREQVKKANNERQSPELEFIEESSMQSPGSASSEIVCD